MVPSDPRLWLEDDAGHVFQTSVTGQRALENLNGPLFALDQKLELNQALDTKIVFEVPVNTKLKAVIEEGPPFLYLLLPTDKQYFALLPEKHLSPISH